MKIGFLSEGDPLDRKYSSGTAFCMAREISLIGELEWIPIKENKFGRILKGVYRRLERIFDCKIRYQSSKLFGKYGLSQSKIDDGSYDIVFAFFCSTYLAWKKKSGCPVIYLTDATFPAMVDYYPEFSGLCSLSLRDGFETELRAMNNSEMVLVGSNWAKNSAMYDLNIPLDKVEVIEYGANIDNSDIRGKVRVFAKGETLQVLFLGVDWNRKGGEKAAEAVEWLNSNGVPAVLNIVGVDEVPKCWQHKEWVNVIGFLNKNDKEQYCKLSYIINDSHLLLLPTVAECSAIAFSEASAFGLPIFSHYTGGVSDYVKDGINGHLLSLESSGADFGKIIKRTIEKGSLKELSEGALRFSSQRLNWERWGNKVKGIIDYMLKRNEC